MNFHHLDTNKRPARRASADDRTGELVKKQHPRNRHCCWTSRWQSWRVSLRKLRASNPAPDPANPLYRKYLAYWNIRPSHRNRWELVA